MDPAAGLEMEEPLNYGTLEDAPAPPPPRRRRPLVVIGGCLVLMGVAATASTRTNLSVTDYPHAHAAAPFHGCALIDEVLRTCNRNAGDSLPLLQGMDVMSYFDASQGLIDQPVRGTKEFVSVYEGNTLYFSSEKNMNTFSYDPSKYMPAGGGYCPLAMSGLDPALSWVCTSVSPIDPLSYEVDSQGRLWLYREPSALFSMAEVYGEWLDSNVKGPSPYSQAVANWANLVALRTGTGQLYPPTMMNKNGRECMDSYGLLKDDDGGDRFLSSSTMATPGFSGSAADMLKKYGKAVPEQQPMSSLADAQAAKARMDADAGAHHHGGVACTEDHGHVEDHGHSSGGDDHAGCTEDHDHGDHGHAGHDHAGHDHAACDGDHGHAEHGHGGHDHADKAPAKFEGCAKGKYAWTDAGTSVAKDDMGSAIRDYAFSDGPKKASVYVDLDGLDALSDDALTITKVFETRVEFSAAFATGTRSLTLSPLHAPISDATLLRKPGKNRVILKLKKAEPAAWAGLLVTADPGPPPAGGGMPGMGGMGGGMGMGGMGGMDMESMMNSMAGMAGVPEPPDLGADAPGGEEDLDDLPDLEEDNVD